MPLLHVALQEGFSNDTVEIRVNGTEVFRKSGVTTRTQIGFADSVETEVDADAVNIMVSLPQKGLSKSLVFPIAEPTYVGVSVAAQGLVLDVSMEPFGYV
jgi:hypothetical protein